MKYILPLMVILLNNTAGYAQFNDSTHYYASYISSGNINQTSTSNSYLLNNAAKFGVKKKNIVLNYTNVYLYGEQQHKLTNNDFSSTLDFNLYQTFPHFYYWGLGNYATSYSLKINNQLQAGAGIAYNFIDRKNAVLNISDGIIYDKSDIVQADTKRNIYDTYRNSLRIQFKVTIKTIFTINGIGFYQNSFTNRQDYIFKASLSTSVKLHKWLSFTAAYAYNDFNRTHSENMLFTYGLTVEKYF